MDNTDSIDANEMVKDIARRERRTIRGQALAEFRTILQNMEAEADSDYDKVDDLMGLGHLEKSEAEGFADGVKSCREALDIFIEGEG